MMAKKLCLVPLLFLVGCAFVNPFEQRALVLEQQAFVSAFDTFQLSHQIEGLQQFVGDYPTSEWTPRARTVILYSQELDQRKSQIDELRSFLLQRTETLEATKFNNERLTLQLEQIKGLLIRMEKR